jgi:hypothetical protein
VVEQARKKWFAHMLQVALDEKVVTPTLLVAHANPEVLAQNLPPDILGRLLSSALSAGAMTPERMLETLTPDILAENIPLDVIWRCVEAGADRTGIAAPDEKAP